MLLDFITDDYNGKKIHPIYKFMIKHFCGDMSNPQPLYGNIQLCRFVGIWYRPEARYTDMLFNSLKILPLVIHFIFAISNICINIYHFNAVVENLSDTLVIVVSLWLAFSFLYKTDKYRKIVEDLAELNRKYDIGLDAFICEKEVRFFNGFFVVYTICGCSAYSFSPIFNTKYCSYSGAVVCGLPSAGSFPYDATTWPGFHLTYLLHVYCAFAFIFIIASTFPFMGMTVLHICAHLKYLERKIYDVCTLETDYQRTKALKQFMNHHGAVLAFSEKAGNDFSPIILANSSALPIIISVLLLQLVLMTVGRDNNDIDLNAVRYFLHMCGWIIELYSVCAVGNYLSDTSLCINTAVYDIPWYDQCMEFRKCLRFMLMRTQKPLVFRVPPAGATSFELFMNIMTSAYSYFTLFYNFIAQ